MLQGTWKDSDGVIYIIEVNSNKVEVVSIIDSDDEEFVVTETIWKMGVLKWTYQVPSTGYVVTVTTESISDDTLECSWKNEYDSGVDILIRLEK